VYSFAERCEKRPVIECEHKSSTQLYKVFTCMYTSSPQQLHKTPIQPHTHSTCSSRHAANQASLTYVASQTHCQSSSRPRRPGVALAPTMNIITCAAPRYQHDVMLPPSISLSSESAATTSAIWHPHPAKKNRTVLKANLCSIVQVLYLQQPNVRCDDLVLLILQLHNNGFLNYAPAPSVGKGAISVALSVRPSVYLSVHPSRT